METSWTGLTAKYSPRFQSERSVFLPNPQQDIQSHDSFKLSFSFAGDKFVTPWITVWDASEGIYLNYVEFVFTFSGDEIVDVDYHVDYNNDPEHKGKVLSNLHLKYSWDQRSLENVDAMLGLLLCGGFGAALTLLLYVIIDTQASAQILDFITSEEEARPVTSSSLPYVDTSSYAFTPKSSLPSRSSPAYVEYDLSRGPMAAMELGSSDSGFIATQPSTTTEEMIPMEPFDLPEPTHNHHDRDRNHHREHNLPDNEEEQAIVMTDDFVPIGTSPHSTATTFLHQPIVRRKAGAAAAAHESGAQDASTTSKDD